MDISTLPRMDPFTGYYFERYAVYLANSNKQKMLEWVSERFDQEITSQLVSEKVSDGNFTLSILGIGSGDGKFEVKMIKKLKKKFRLIECIVVEPSGEQIATYKNLVEKEKNALYGVTFDWRQETLQNFCKTKSENSMKFHFVSLIHSTYYLPKQDFDYYMKEISRWTEGKIVIMQEAENSVFGLLAKELSATFSNFQPNILGNRVMDSLKRQAISFEVNVLPCELDVTCCLDKDSQEGRFLLDFVIQVVGLVDDGPPEVVRMIQEFLKSASYMRNGRYIVVNPTQVFIITPNLWKKM